MLVLALLLKQLRKQVAAMGATAASFFRVARLRPARPNRAVLVMAFSDGCWRCGFRFDHAGPGLRMVGRGCLICELGEQLALLNPIANVDGHLGR